MTTPTPAAMRAAKKLFPMTKSGQSDKSIAAFHSAKALEIDAATGLPDLIEALRDIVQPPDDQPITGWSAGTHGAVIWEGNVTRARKLLETLSGNDAGNK